MAQAVRSKLLRNPKQEREIRVHNNPLDENGQTDPANTPLLSPHTTSPSTPNTALRTQTSKNSSGYDYQAPLTAESLKPNSRWLIVRRNLHRIRFMGYHTREKDSALPDFYLGLQMKRELKRAQEEIKNIDKETNFQAVKHFVLAVDNQREKTYDTRHVKPNDALVYDRLGDEPLPLQNLLYYFSQQPVPHGTVFWDFLNEVNHVLDMNRKRTVLVQRLKRLAFMLAIIFYGFIGFMFFLMIISVVTTATKMNDPEVQWIDNPGVNRYATGLVTPT